MSAHLCKQIYSSWRQTHPPTPEALPSTTTTTAGSVAPSYPRRSPSPGKSSMDSDRSDSSNIPATRQQSNSSWK